MMRFPFTAAVIAAALLPAAHAAAGDFSLSYDVDRYPAAKLSLQACRAALARGAAAVGYVARMDQDQGTLAVHLSGPAGAGRSLLSYCIGAGDQTVFVVQALDYTRTDSAEADRVKARVAAEIRKAAAVR